VTLQDPTTLEIREGDVLDRLRGIDAGSIQCCITSPPYFGLRDYGLPAGMWGDGWIGCLGLEPSVDQFVVHLVEVFAEVRRVLRDDGTLWLNLGDSYAGGGNGARDPERWPKQSRNNGGDRITHAKKQTGAKPKDLLGVPWMVALALRADGWYLRSDIIWSKPNAMPESVADRPSNVHEHVFLLAPNANYYYDADAIREPLATKTLTTFGSTRGRNGGGPLVKADNWARDIPERRPRVDADGEPVGANKRSVWEVAAKAYPEAHFATFPPKLIEPMVLAGCPGGGLVLDPFAGSGTTLQVAVERGRNALGIELNPAYVSLAEKRLSGVTAPLFTSSEAA
jgi:DNA modification methylase